MIWIKGQRNRTCSYWCDWPNQLRFLCALPSQPILCFFLLPPSSFTSLCICILHRTYAASGPSTFMCPFISSRTLSPSVSFLFRFFFCTPTAHLALLQLSAPCSHTLPYLVSSVSSQAAGTLLFNFSSFQSYTPYLITLIRQANFSALSLATPLSSSRIGLFAKLHLLISVKRETAYAV